MRTLVPLAPVPSCELPNTVHTCCPAWANLELGLPQPSGFLGLEVESPDPRLAGAHQQEPILDGVQSPWEAGGPDRPVSASGSQGLQVPWGHIGGHSDLDLRAQDNPSECSTHPPQLLLGGCSPGQAPSPNLESHTQAGAEQEPLA
jgi:hypothetical protein